METEGRRGRGGGVRVSAVSEAQYGLWGREDVCEPSARLGPTGQDVPGPGALCQSARDLRAREKPRLALAHRLIPRPAAFPRGTALRGAAALHRRRAFFRSFRARGKVGARPLTARADRP